MLGLLKIDPNRGSRYVPIVWYNGYTYAESTMWFACADKQEINT